MSEYTIDTDQAGEFRIVRIQGAYDNALLDDLRTKIFPENTHFAIDASHLKGFTTPFARELAYSAKLMRDVGLRMVFLRPPDRLRSMMQMVEPDHDFAVFASEEHLRDGGDQSAHESHELERILKDLRTNPDWQYFDRAGCWICPFCGTLREEIAIPSPEVATTSDADTVYRHLWFSCGRYSPVNPNPLGADALKRIRLDLNKEKVVVTKSRMKNIESQLTYLGDKAKQAEGLQQSAKLASERQLRLMPERPPEGLDAGIVYRPAEHVSGDFYDFVILDDRIAFLIGDVAGHGMEAGILMGMAKKLLAVRLKETGDPVRAICMTNNDLHGDLKQNAFVTMLIVIFDLQNGTVTSVRAGHNPLLRYHPDRGLFQFEEGGMGVGLTNGPMFERKLAPQTETIRTGDTYLLYTDGLTEAANQKKEEFGIDRVVQVMKGDQGLAAPLLLQNLSQELDRFVGGLPQEDDITMLCTRFA